eukprot:443481-Prorocentrum_minimum.AAC.1
MVRRDCSGGCAATLPPEPPPHAGTAGGGAGTRTFGGGGGGGGFSTSEAFPAAGFPAVLGFRVRLGGSSSVRPLEGTAEGTAEGLAQGATLGLAGATWRGLVAAPEGSWGSRGSCRARQSRSGVSCAAGGSLGLSLRVGAARSFGALSEKWAVGRLSSSARGRGRLAERHWCARATTVTSRRRTKRDSTRGPSSSAAFTRQRSSWGTSVR